MPRDILLAVALQLLPLAAWGAQPALYVTHARLGSASLSTQDGRVLIRAIIDDTAAGGGQLEEDLLGGRVVVRVDDAGSFHASIPLTSCRRVGSGIRCSVGAARGRLKRTGTPGIYRLGVSTFRLGTAAAGVAVPKLPVRVTIAPTGAPDRIDVISDCRALGARGLGCRDRKRPNIIFIVTDDQRADTVQYMPQTLAALADQGVLFSNAFVTTPLCSPSRSSMLTGLYARNHGVRRNAGLTGGASAFVGADVSTVATWLHDTGYRTGMIGKYMTGYAAQCPPFAGQCYIPPGWDDWRVFLTQGYYNYQLAENSSVQTYGNTDADYSTDVLTAKAVEFIDNAHGQPFFLHLGYHAPHSEGGALPLPARRHAGTFRGFPPLGPPTLPPWRPPSYDEEDIGDKPAWMADLARADDVIGSVQIGNYFEIGRLVQLETLLAVDEGIAALVAALEANGQTENTVIVFTSDNGYFWGEHRLFAGKDYPYEESLRVPLMVRYPLKVPAAREDDNFILSVDIAPTLAELAGTPAPAVDGTSFAPLLADPSAPWRDAFVFEWFGEQLRLPDYVGIFTSAWQFIDYPAVGEAELYDRGGDPYQLDNQAGNPAYDDVVARLREQLIELAP